MGLYRYSYYITFWSIFSITTALAIIDRFTTNIWPRQDFAYTNSQNQTVRFGGDFIDGLKPGPWTVKIYDILARISGRYAITSCNALFLTMMTTSHVLLEDTYIGRNVIDFSDVHARIKCHIITGVSMCVLMILHMWTVLFPVFFSKFSVEVKSGSFRFPLSEGSPSGFKDQRPYANQTEDGFWGHTMLQVDDLARLIVITIILVPLMIFSYKKFSSNYRLGIRVHQFIFILYFIDLIRRHTHPHCWIINVPVFVLWVFDKILGYIYQHEKIKANYFKISEDYSLVYFKVGQAEKNIDNLAQIYYSRLVGFGRKFERKHPFTCFKNRNSGLGKSIFRINKYSAKLESGNDVLTLNSSGSRSNSVYHWDQVRDSVNTFGHSVLKSPTKTRHLEIQTEGNDFADAVKSAVKFKNEEKYDWTTAYILKIFNKEWSHTKYFADYSKSVFSNRVNVWPGGSYNQIKKDIFENTPMILVAGGAGANFILDVISFVKANKSSIERTNLLGICSFD